MNIFDIFKHKSIPIGILDGGLEGINVFESLSKKYPHQQFIYINDLNNYPYEEKTETEIANTVKKNVEELLKYNVSKIIVVNNSIIEYCEDYLKSLNIPVIKITDILINYLNNNYEHKNILLLAKQYIIKANLYQKNLKYNHLYNVFSDELEEVILKKQVRTAKSFEKMQEVLSTVNNREYNILVYVDSYMQNFRIEFNEYNIGNDILDYAEVVSKAVEEEIDNTKRNKGNLIISDLEKKEFLKSCYWLDNKYKFIKIGE